MTNTRALSGAAFCSLLIIALMMGANHVAARIAFNHGANVSSAVVFRSLITASVVGLMLLARPISLRLTPRQRWMMPLIGVMIGVQSLCLYSAVSRLPVALALLAFNTFPLWAAFSDRLLYRQTLERRTLKAMPFMLFGLALALDIAGATTGLGVAGRWQEIGIGVLFAVAAGATFGCAMVLTQHEAGVLDGRVRALIILSIAGIVAALSAVSQTGFQFPRDSTGWWGLLALSALYGSAFTFMISFLPKLGVAGNAAIMNVEPIFALILAWLVLDQRIAPTQLVGAFLVVGTVVFLGLRKGQSAEFEPSSVRS